jgi:hypothetical protein
MWYFHYFGGKRRGRYMLCMIFDDVVGGKGMGHGLGELPPKMGDENIPVYKWENDNSIHVACIPVDLCMDPLAARDRAILETKRNG